MDFIKQNHCKPGLCAPFWCATHAAVRQSCARKPPAARCLRNSTGLALATPERRLFFSGDTGYGPHFVEIGQRLGPFDWVALDMGQYDPRWANVHMNPEQAAQAAEELHTKVLKPPHAGRFSISPHDWDDPFKRITAASQGRSYALWTPEIGRPVHLDGRAQTFVAWWAGVRRPADARKAA